MRKFDGLVGLTHGFNLKRNALIFPNKTAIIDIEQNKRSTYRQFNEQVNRLGNALFKLGVKKGDKIVLLMGDRLEFIEFMYAINKIGAVWVPINYRSIADEVEYIVNNSNASYIVYGEEFENMIGGSKENFEAVKKNGYISLGSNPMDGCLSYSEMLVGASVDEPPVVIIDTDICSMVYTSGTTGGPKGALRNYRTSLGWAFDAIIGANLSYSDRMLNPFPLFHQGGSILSIAILAIGGTIVIPGPFDPIKTLRVIQAESITAAAFASTISNLIMNLPESELKKYDVSSLCKLINGASALLTDTKEGLLDYFPNLHLFEHLSSTEAFFVMLPYEDIMTKERCVGLPGFGMEVKLLNDSGDEVPQGQPGIIYGRGISVFNGYYNNPAANEKAFMGEWFTAEDIGRFDEDGYLYVIDRKKDMILTGGENVASIDVENVLTCHPDVLEAAAIGVPDEKWGERVHAMLVLKNDVELSENDIIEWCQGKLAGYKKPRSVEFKNELPKTTSGKILKTELRKKYWDQQDVKIN